ncbi:MAG: extracellular solute-binding protein [Elusimicrobia bacterium]|nr:extracellular solute-binding protein [Elusimicrobiota bacterium]
MKTRSVLASLLLVAPFIGGCKSEKSASAEKSVVVWHWMTDRDEALQQLAQKYKQQTGVSVQFQLYAPSDVYQQKVRVGAQTSSLPDIFGILGDARDVAEFVEAGHVENLTSQLGDGPGSWKDSFYAEALNTTYFRPGNSYNVKEGYYGIPIDVTTIPMIYNKKLFAKAGLNPDTPPATWAQFLEAGKKLKAAGVTGFTSGWGESWLIYSLATDLAYNVMGEEKMIKTFKGEVPYTDPQWLEVFKAFDQMRLAGFADPSLVTLGNKSAEQAFSSERSGITFNGSWAVNVYAGMNPSLEYAPFRPPSLGGKYPQTVWGGAGSVFMVNGKSSNKEAAVAFLKWLSAKEQAAFLATATKNLPAVKDVGGDLPPVLKQFADMMKDSIHPNRFEVDEDPKVQEALNKGIQSILIGEMTPEQAAAETQKAKLKLAGK